MHSPTVDEECELSLDNIHLSIESTITSIRERHEQVDCIFGDLSYLKRVAVDVLEPISQKAGLQNVATIANLHTLLARWPRTSPPNSAVRKTRIPTPPTKPKPLLRATSEGGIDFHKAKGTALPPITRRSFSTTHRHVSASGSEIFPGDSIVLPISVNRTCRTVLHVMRNSDVDTRSKLPFITHRRERPFRRPNNEATASAVDRGFLDIKRFELKRFSDDFEAGICVLQETFSTFTQRGLVSLQTFCKHCDETMARTRRERSGDEVKNKVSISNERLGKTEFRIVQTMNHIRQLLWPSSDSSSLPEHLFCNDHFSLQVSEHIDCKKFPIIRLVPDVLQKFNEVLTLASTWLKRDAMCVQNTKSVLQRAHKRFLKTEKLWREARDCQRRVRAEWENASRNLETVSSKLDSVEQEIANLTGEMERSQKVKMTLEENMKSVDDDVESMVAKHRAFRKRVVVLSTKIEARERSYGFLESRVLSLNADQKAASEKLRISEEYASNLQSKMEKLYELRNAWSRRYVGKTDPDKLRIRLQQSRIRMPLPSLREKTFIMRKGMENLRHALDLVEKRLGDNEVYWSKLCEQLPWPEECLPKIIGDSKGLQPDAEANKSDPLVSRIREKVSSTRPADGKQQRSLLLQLWMEENGKEATLEKLLQALRASDISSVVTNSIERCVFSEQSRIPNIQGQL